MKQEKERERREDGEFQKRGYRLNGTIVQADEISCG